VSPPSVPAAFPTLAGAVDSALFTQASGTLSNGGLSAFLGFTALVLTGFLVLARLSQRVVDDTESTESGGPVRAPADPAPGDPDAADPPRIDDPRRADASDVGFGDEATDTGVSRDRTDRTGARSSEYGPFPPGAGTGSEHRDERVLAGSDPAQTDANEGVDELASIPPGALLANVALTQGLFGGVLAAAAWFFQVPAPVLGLGGGRIEGITAVAVGLVFGVVLWAGNEVASALADAAGAGYDEGLRQLLAPGDARGWTILLGGVLPVVALVEEFIFRAAAVGAASAALGGTPVAAWALAVVSSLAFALGHGAQGRVGIVVTGALGFVLAAGFLVSGSFVVVVVAHYVVNALEFLVHEAAGLPDPIWA